MSSEIDKTKSEYGKALLTGEHLEQDIERDKEQAIEWFTKSANDGNEYAQAMLDNISKFENDLLVNTILSLSLGIKDEQAQNYE